MVSRRGELNRDLLSSTCEYEDSKEETSLKVRCSVGLKCRLGIEFCTHTGAKKIRTSNFQFLKDYYRLKTWN